MKRTAGVAAASAAAVALVQSIAAQGATANAGADQVAMSVAAVSLNGGESKATKGGKLGYNWSQVSGPGVQLDDTGAATPRFTAPPVTPGQNVELVFELSVSESGQPATKDQVSVWVMSWKAVDNGYRHTVALRSDGSLWAWGENCKAQVGQGNTDCVKYGGAVTRVGTDSDWTDIAAGHSHTLALKGDGSLWAWGADNHGQTGQGCTASCTTTNVPSRLGSDNDWVAIAAGTHSSFALKASGELYAWGENSQGRLGLGDTSTSRVGAPRRVMDGVVQVSTSGTHTLVLRSDGSISGFGSNAQLQLTKAVQRQVTTPMRVAGPAGWSFVSAGDGLSFAIKGDELFGFGRGKGGALGLGECPGEGTECAVGTPTSLGAGWRSASASSASGLGVKIDGSGWGWGDNTEGQLGTGDTAPHYKPVRLPTGGWYSITTQTEWERQKATFGLKADGTLWAWGWGNFGELGSPVKGAQTAPLQVEAPVAGVKLPLPAGKPAASTRPAAPVLRAEDGSSSAAAVGTTGETAAGGGESSGPQQSSDDPDSAVDEATEALKKAKKKAKKNLDKLLGM